MRSNRITAALFAVVLAMLTVLRGAAANPDATRCTASGTFFCSEFEEGNFSVWDTVNGPGSATIVSDPGPFGDSTNHVLRLYVPPSVSGAGANVIKTFTGAQKVYARWYAKWESGYDFGAMNHGGGLHGGFRWDYGRSGTRPNGTDWYSTWLEPVSGGGVSASDTGRLNLYSYYPGMYMDCSDPNGSCWGDHLPCMVGSGYCTKTPVRVPPPTPPVLTTNRWYCLEVMLDGGTPTPSQSGANGVQDFWVDGQEIGPWTNLWHRSTATGMNVNLLSLALYFHNTHADAGVRFDNVVVSTSRIGCAATTPAPAAPSNVRIIR